MFTSNFIVANIEIFDHIQNAKFADETSCFGIDKDIIR